MAAFEWGDIIFARTQGDGLGFWPAVIYKPEEIKDPKTKKSAIQKSATHNLVTFISPLQVQWAVVKHCDCLAWEDHIAEARKRTKSEEQNNAEELEESIRIAEEEMKQPSGPGGREFPKNMRPEWIKPFRMVELHRFMTKKPRYLASHWQLKRVEIEYDEPDGSTKWWPGKVGKFNQDKMTFEVKFDEQDAPEIMGLEDMFTTEVRLYEKPKRKKAAQATTDNTKRAKLSAEPTTDAHAEEKKEPEDATKASTADESIEHDTVPNNAAAQSDKDKHEKQEEKTEVPKKSKRKRQDDVEDEWQPEEKRPKKPTKKKTPASKKNNKSKKNEKSKANDKSKKKADKATLAALAICKQWCLRLKEAYPDPKTSTECDKKKVKKCFKEIVNSKSSVPEAVLHGSDLMTFVKTLTNAKHVKVALWSTRLEDLLMKKSKTKPKSKKETTPRSSVKMAPKPATDNPKKKTASESAIKAKTSALPPRKPSSQKQSATKNDSKKKSVIKDEKLPAKVAKSTEKGISRPSKKARPAKSETQKNKMLTKAREKDSKTKTTVKQESPKKSSKKIRGQKVEAPSLRKKVKKENLQKYTTTPIAPVSSQKSTPSEKTGKPERKKSTTETVKKRKNVIPSPKKAKSDKPSNPDGKISKAQPVFSAKSSKVLAKRAASPKHGAAKDNNKQKLATDKKDVSKQKSATDKKDVSKQKSATDKKDASKQKSATDKKDVSKQKSTTDNVSKQKSATDNVSKQKSATDKKDVSKPKSATDKKDVSKSKSATDKKDVSKQKSATDKKDVSKQKSATDKKDVSKQKSTTDKKDVSKPKSTTDKKDVSKQKSATDNVSKQNSTTDKKVVSKQKSATDKNTDTKKKAVTEKNKQTIRAENGGVHMIGSPKKLESNDVDIQKITTSAGTDKDADTNEDCLSALSSPQKQQNAATPFQIPKKKRAKPLALKSESKTLPTAPVPVQKQNVNSASKPSSASKSSTSTSSTKKSVIVTDRHRRNWQKMFTFVLTQKFSKYAVDLEELIYKDSKTIPEYQRNVRDSLVSFQINDTVKQMMQAGESVKDIRRHLDMEEPSMEQVYKLLCKLCDRFKAEHMEKHAQASSVRGK